MQISCTFTERATCRLRGDQSRRRLLLFDQCLCMININRLWASTTLTSASSVLLNCCIFFVSAKTSSVNEVANLNCALARIINSTLIAPLACPCHSSYVIFFPRAPSCHQSLFWMQEAHDDFGDLAFYTWGQNKKSMPISPTLTSTFLFHAYSISSQDETRFADFAATRHVTNCQVWFKKFTLIPWEHWPIITIAFSWLIIVIDRFQQSSSRPLYWPPKKHLWHKENHLSIE